MSRRATRDDDDEPDSEDSDPEITKGSAPEEVSPPEEVAPPPEEVAAAEGVHKDKVTMDMMHRGTMDMTHKGTIYGPSGGCQQETRMYGWAREPEFQFQPLPASNSYGSVSSSHAQGSSSYSDSGFQSTQQLFTPRGIQKGMNVLVASLFGYSEYSEYKNPIYGFQ
ncbi:hypothetical protein Taro_004260 [Colocasia esculenta]|uniref:Uncharacterized protein n=1 Tax=Colocasia esculenta TaxID=4460 RepID=A0A843TR60_COLES|nr:hypothetical protein [Colocasia esculenta]